MTKRLVTLLVSSGVVVLLLLMAEARAMAQSGPLPAWFDADIGDVGQPGGSRQSDDTFNVSGAGADIWGPSDSFHFTYTNLDGDGDIWVYARSQTATNPFAKAGVMIRQSLDPGSPHVVLDVKPDGGVEFMERAYLGGTTFFLSGVSQTYPVWLRLSRRGQYVAAFISTPSMCQGMGCYYWTMISNGWQLWQSGPALIGLAVTSHDTSSLNDAVLDFLDLRRLNAPWQQTDLYTPTQPDSAWTIPASGNQTDTFLVPAAGTDIWGTVDSFKYVWQPVFGDSAMIIARVLGEDYFDHPDAKAGVLMRESTNPSAASVVLDVKPDGGVEFMARPTYRADTTFVAGGYQLFPAWLKLVKSGDQFSAYTSGDGNAWAFVGTKTASLSPNGAAYAAGLAATTHDSSAPPWATARFDEVSLSGETPTNLLQEPGFEGYGPSDLGTPGWQSDRQITAISETAEPHSGQKNGACRQTSNADCGLFQDVVVPATGNYIVTLYANADRPGGLVGVNVNGATGASADVAVRGAGNYGAAYTLRVTAKHGDTVRVWMYSPATPGSQVIDDVALAFAGP